MNFSLSLENELKGKTVKSRNIITPLSALLCGIALWLCIFICNRLHILSSEQVSFISATLELFFHVGIIYLGINVYRNLPENDKPIFYWILPANIFLFITDINFYLVAYILKREIDDISLLYFISYYVPFIAWVYVSALFLYKLLIPNLKKAKQFIIAISVLFTFNVIVTALFLLPILHGDMASSSNTIYQVVAFMCKLIFFDMIILCLTCAQEIWFILYLVGNSIVIASDFLFNYSATASKINIAAYGEWFWFLGIILLLCSFLSIDKHKNYNMAIFFKKYNSIKSQMVFLSFSVCIVSFLLFLIPVYFFDLINKHLFSAIPCFIMVYSLLVVIFSRYLGTYFEKPFKLLAKNIEMFVNNKTAAPIKQEFEIEEFDFLQKFILNAFELNQENEQSKKDLVEIAAQVAHDIRSPITAILMLTKEYKGVPDEIRVTLRGAANRIRDIANNLLMRSIGKKPDEDTAKEFPISVAALSVISEKKAEYKNTDIEIIFDISKEAKFSFIRADLTNLKCVLSNLINNAVEAIREKGRILIKIFTKDNAVYVSVTDSGCGMPKEVRDKILSGNVISTKKDGFGLGFCHVRKFISETDARLDISYPEQGGTEITIIFEEVVQQSWLAKEITLSLGNTVVILDDEPAIHSFWDYKLEEFKKRKEIEVVHYSDGYECAKYLKGLSLSQLSKVTFLTDYELGIQKINGLDVVEMSRIHQATLVTGYGDDKAFLKRAMLLNVRIVPKYLLDSFEISLLEKSESQEKNIEVVVLEDNKELSHVMAYLFKFRNKQVDIYHDIYALLESLSLYDLKITKFCLDFDLGSLVNGIELADVLYSRGCKNLYLASGYQFKEEDVPAYLKILPNKMDVLNL